MAKDALYEGEREVKTYVDLFHGSQINGVFITLIGVLNVKTNFPFDIIFTSDR